MDFGKFNFSNPQLPHLQNGFDKIIYALEIWILHERHYIKQATHCLTLSLHSENRPGSLVSEIKVWTDSHPEISEIPCTFLKVAEKPEDRVPPAKILISGKQKEKGEEQDWLEYAVLTLFYLNLHYIMLHCTLYVTLKRRTKEERMVCNIWRKKIKKGLYAPEGRDRAGSMESGQSGGVVLGMEHLTSFSQSLDALWGKARKLLSKMEDRCMLHTFETKTAAPWICTFSIVQFPLLAECLPQELCQPGRIIEKKEIPSPFSVILQHYGNTDS
jgi:hypothetical protein